MKKTSMTAAGRRNKGFGFCSLHSRKFRGELKINKSMTDMELADIAHLCQKWWNEHGEDGTTLSESLSYVVFVAEKELDRRMFPDPLERKQEEINL